MAAPGVFAESGRDTGACTVSCCWTDPRGPRAVVNAGSSVSLDTAAWRRSLGESPGVRAWEVPWLSRVLLKGPQAHHPAWSKERGLRIPRGLPSCL